MIREIGSEFWDSDTCSDETIVFGASAAFLLTGRSALEFIIRDIKADNSVISASLPSYCCHTMIKPFLDNNISVEFYDVTYKNGKISFDPDAETHGDIVLVMQYFGFGNTDAEQKIKKEKRAGKIVIEDATQSWFSGHKYSDCSDYVFTSFRKWTGLPCGSVAMKNNKPFALSQPPKTNTAYIDLRKRAAALKKEYICNKTGAKEHYLGLFRQAEELLEHDYSNYAVPEDIINSIRRIDARKICAVRNKNALYLIRGLEMLPGVRTVKFSESDVPLFVPIFVKDGKRNALHDFLIRHSVYCPIHWPLSELHHIKDRDLYDNSISLICDQRYGISDMKKIIQLIYQFYGEKYES